MSVMWAVSSGEYSSYGVHLLCRTQELAEAISQRLNERDDWSSSVETFEIAESLADADQVLRHRGLILLDDGREESPWAWQVLRCQDPGDEVEVYKDRIVAWSSRGADVALKIARDKYAQWKAEQAGL